MAQHDQVVDNGPGLAVRTDFNSALAALFSSNSGPIEPTVKVAGQLWFDTSAAGAPAGRLKVRNIDNTVWTDLLGAAGSFNVPLALTGLEASGVSKAYVGFVETDIGFGVRKAGNPAGSPIRFVWNDRADLTGTDRMQLSETGALLVGTLPANLPAGIRAGSIIGNNLVTAQAFGINTLIVEGPPAKWITQAAGFAALWTLDPANGNWGLSRTSASRAAGADFGASNSPIYGNGSDSHVRSHGAFIANNGMYAAGDASFGLAIYGNNRYFYYSPSWYEVWNGVNGDRSWVGGSTNYMWNRGSDASFFVAGAAFKPGGGAWADSSDSRIKNVTGDYEKGLAEIIALRPVRYTFKGNDTPNPANALPTTPQSQPQSAGGPVPMVTATEQDYEEAPYPNSPHYLQATSGQEFIGLIAQEAEQYLPSMVTQVEGWIDGVKIADMRNLDTGPLLFAIVNALKEVNTRLVALEGGTA